MREDFGKCVIESPRRGSRSENKHTRERVRPCDWERYQDAGRDQGWRRSMYFGARSARMAVNRRAVSCAAFRLVRSNRTTTPPRTARTVHPFALFITR